MCVCTVYLCRFPFLIALKTVNTEDLDVESVPNKEGEQKREHAIPGQITRDTADSRIAGGKQVIRMVTTKQKTNPFNIVGTRSQKTCINNEKNGHDFAPAEELTMGQKLAMKHYLMDPKKKEKNKVIFWPNTCRFISYKIRTSF